MRLVLDASASLDVGTPSKLHVAKRIAAAVGYMALASSERAQVLAASEGRLEMREPVRGRDALAKLVRELDAIVPGRGTDLASAIDGVVLRAPRPGMLVVVSDFFDAGPFDGALGRAASAGHDVCVLQVLAPEELDPPWDGDLALEDVETGQVLEMTLDARAVESYLARLSGLVALLRAFAKKHRATYVRVRTSDPLLDAVRRFVARAVD